jgi:hypothetical protein
VKYQVRGKTGTASARDRQRDPTRVVYVQGAPGWQREIVEGYRAMAADEAREREAAEWAENLIGDVADEPR